MYRLDQMRPILPCDRCGVQTALKGFLKAVPFVSASVVAHAITRAPVGALRTWSGTTERNARTLGVSLGAHVKALVDAALARVATADDGRQIVQRQNRRPSIGEMGRLRAGWVEEEIAEMRRLEAAEAREDASLVEFYFAEAAA